MKYSADDKRKHVSEQSEILSLIFWDEIGVYMDKANCWDSSENVGLMMDGCHKAIARTIYTYFCPSFGQAPKDRAEFSLLVEDYINSLREDLIDIYEKDVHK